MLGDVVRLVVEPLTEHDAEHGSALTESLRVYLERHGHWESAAAALGIHRHTLRGRVSRAEQVLGVDLQSAAVRAELLLALLAHDGADRASSPSRRSAIAD